MKSFARLINKGSTNFEAAKVIPKFDPDNQTAENWIKKVNDAATIYDWNEKTTIFHALSRFTGYARKWLEGLHSIKLNWRQWQRKIKNTFPDDRNYTDKLTEMLERTSKREESLEEYYHDKIRLVITCGIRGRNAVDCVIGGIFDNNIRLNAQGNNYKKPSQVLRFLRRLSKKNSTLTKKNVRNNFTTHWTGTNTTVNKPTTTSSNQKTTRPIWCYNCHESGHRVDSCNKPVIKCGFCSKIGHKTSDCRKRSNNNSNTKSAQNILQINTNENGNGKYFKSILLNNTTQPTLILVVSVH